MLRYLAVLAVLGAPAFADELDPHRIAVAVNAPISWHMPDWEHQGAVAISGWAGLTAHQAIRANFATYDPDYSPLAVLAGRYEECAPQGNTKDLGAAWVYFPRALYSGPSLEAGALRRSTTESVRYCDLATYIDTDRSSVTYAARAMVGWSWTIGSHAFIALAVGASTGRERGTSDRRQDRDMGFETLPVDQWTSSFESYLRFGAAL